MASTLYQQLHYAIHQVFRILVPEPHNRTPLTLSAVPLIFASFWPFLFLAYLSRRKDTYLIRLLLLPSTICALLSWPYRYTWTTPQLNVYNWGQTLLAGAVIAKALELALTKEGMLKVGQKEVEEISFTSTTTPVTQTKGEPETHNGEANGHADPEPEAKVDKSSHRDRSILPYWLYDAFELTFNMRGLGFRFGLGTHIPPPDRPQTRNAFLRATFRSWLINFLMLDFLESMIKFVPGVGSVQGGTIFFPQLSIPLRYLTSSAIHFCVGQCLLAGFGMIYDLVTLISVGLIGSSPSSWPPVLDHPWYANSLHELWAKCWQQLLRRTFIVFGGYPGNWIGGNIGMLFGTFLASGLYHELTIYALGHGFEWTPVIFFTMQAVLLIFERVWRQVTGRRVGGIPGRLWVYFDMFILGQPMVDSWLRRGLGGAMIIHPVASPTRWIAELLMKGISNSWI